MASIRKQKSGSWRVQVRRKGRSVSENFVRHEDAKRWGVDAERQIDRGDSPTTSRVGKLKTFGDLIDLHIADMSEVGKAPRRSKEATLKMLKRELGKRTMGEIDRDCLVKFGRGRAAQGAGPMTLSIDIGMISAAVLAARTSDAADDPASPPLQLGLRSHSEGYRPGSWVVIKGPRTEDYEGSRHLAVSARRLWLQTAAPPLSAA